ncbi:MAG: tRNA-dihydrouridine synthase family protein [Corallococcus sp.]|nr:tRNA-dihydrouridine synthase family protein [Corallococcus sp.]
MKRNSDIRSLFCNTNVALAPMAGYTDTAFRAICREYGVRYTVTEMVSAKALVMGNANTETLLQIAEGDEPCVVQIFGHEPQVMTESLSHTALQKYKAVDINMGCPVKKIVQNGDGSALAENPQLARDIISAMSKATDKFVTVKMRLGVNDKSGAADFARMCEDAGAQLLTVHLRTRNQMYSGTADYGALKDIVNAVNIPVVANGDVTDRQCYLRLLDEGAFAVAVGRGALGRPYIFAQLQGKPYTFDLLQTLKRHIDKILTYKSERVAANEIKKHIAYYLKGLRGAKQTLVEVNAASTLQSQLDAVCRFTENLK